jgi:hypothetical protein
MKPYTTILTSEESMQIYHALAIGLSAAQFIGNKAVIDKISAAHQMLGNHAVSGGFESQAERDAHYLDSFDADCAKHGSD